VIFSGGGDDSVEGGGGNDVINTGNGNDEVGGGSGADVIFGGAGDDVLGGGEGNDVIFGGAGNDEISGNSDDDIIRDGTGADSIWGRQGDDTIFLSDDSETDVIVFRTDGDAPEAGVDTIFGFDPSDTGGDRLDLINSKFKLVGYDVLLESDHGGTLVSIDPDGEDPRCDAIPLAFLVGIDPGELVDIDSFGHATSDIILTNEEIIVL
jgi:Ca2+-binding RTX toxin-like protein